MTTKLLRLSLVVAVFALCTVGLASAGNLVQNGNFGTGDFTDWQVTGDTTFVGVCSASTCPGGFAPPAGDTYAAYFGPVGDTASISQMLNTTPGQEYTLTFSLALPTAGTPNYFSVSLGSSTFSLTNFGGSFGWETFTLSDMATSNHTPLIFTFRNDPAYWFLDDVNVSSGGGTVPEPGTLALFGSGVLGIAGFARRKFRP